MNYCAPREYKTLRALRRGETVTLECSGWSFKMDGDGEVAVGDTYIGERNTGPHFLEAHAIDRRGWVVPTTEAYYYDTGECIKVIRVPTPA